METESRPTPLLLIHGFPLDARMWRHTLAFFDGSRRVFAPDLSGLLGQARDFTIRDAASALLKWMPARKAVVAGLSMGGYIALEMWKAAPERFAGIVLVDTKAEADTPEAKAGRDAMAAAIEAGGVIEATKSMRERLLSPLAPQSVRDELLGIVSAQDASFLVACQRAMRDREDNVGTLPHVTVPALVVVGADDVITPPETARRMAALLPESHLDIVPRAGHLTPMEAPDAFGAALERWLIRHGL